MDGPNLALGMVPPTPPPPSHRENRHTPLLSHRFDFYSSGFLVLLCCLVGPTMLQPSALPVCAQPAQTFHGISCSDRQGFLLVPPGKLEWLLLWAGLSSPGRDSDACYLPAPRTCLSSHGTQPAGPYLDLPVGLRPPAGPAHLLEHTRTPRSQCSQGTPGAQRCRGSSTPRGCRAHAALAPVQSGYDLEREWEMLCPKQPCLQSSLGMRQGDPRAAPHPWSATTERGAGRSHLKATPAPWPQRSQFRCRALPMSGRYVSRLRDKFPSMIWQWKRSCGRKEMDGAGVQ